MDSGADDSFPEREHEPCEVTAHLTPSPGRGSQDSRGSVLPSGAAESGWILGPLTQNLWMLLSEYEQLARWVRGLPWVVLLMVLIRPEFIKCMTSAQDQARTRCFSSKHFLPSYSM